MLFFSQNRKPGDRQSRWVQLCKGIVKHQDSCYLPALPFLTCSFCPHGHKWLRHFQASHLSSRLGERVRGKSLYQLNLCPFIKKTIPVQKPHYKNLYMSHWPQMSYMDLLSLTWRRQIFSTRNFANFAAPDKLRIVLERREGEMDIGRQPAVYGRIYTVLLSEATGPRRKPRGCDPSQKALKPLKPQSAAFRVSSLLIISRHRCQSNLPIAPAPSHYFLA